MSEAPDYAFPHSAEVESRRLELLEQRLDPLTKQRWATSPQSTQVAFPNLALSQGRSLLRQIHQLGLEDVGADAEIDIIRAGSDLAEFYQLSQAALRAQPRAGDRAHRPARRR